MIAKRENVEAKTDVCAIVGFYTPIDISPLMVAEENVVSKTYLKLMGNSRVDVSHTIEQNLLTL